MEKPNNNNLKKRDSDHVKIVNYLKNNNGIKLKDLHNDLILNLPTWSDKYVFSWDNIPGKDNERLINYLKLYFGTDWVKTEKIEKIDNGKVIRISDNKNSLSLSLNDEINKVNLKIDDGKFRELNAKMENGKLNIYINGPILIKNWTSLKYQQYDILCFNNKDKDIVIVEVKSETADYKTFGQILYYIDQVEEFTFPYVPDVNTVQGIILAKEISSSLKQLVNKYKNTIPKINLKKYDWVGDNLEITDIILSNDI